MIAVDLTPLLDRLGSQAEDQLDTLPLQDQIDQLDRIVDALVAYLGLNWCSDCANLHQPDSHTGNGTGFSQSSLPGADVMGPGP
jgi:hypothetical protein